MKFINNDKGYYHIYMQKKDRAMIDDRSSLELE